jgi:hypothetical protein
MQANPYEPPQIPRDPERRSWWSGFWRFPTLIEWCVVAGLVFVIWLLFFSPIIIE